MDSKKPFIRVNAINNIKARILEGFGGEEQCINLTASPSDVTYEAISSDNSLLKVLIKDNILNIIPIAKGIVTVTIIASRDGYIQAKDSLDIDISRYVESGEYKYKNITIPGGGFVTGFLFHPSVPDILYCRTDIGGNYRYDFKKEVWISLIDHATDPNKWETYPLSIALDKNNQSYIYSMVGEGAVSKIAFSENYGENWTYLNTPVIDGKGNTVRIHGNCPGRSTDERLVVDPNAPDTLYMATTQDGLWKTEDRCNTWTKLNVAYPNKKGETDFAFVMIDEKSGSLGVPSKIIIAATNGREGSTGGNVRGPSIYISCDGGNSFQVLKGAPQPVLGGPKDYPGYVGQRAVFDEKYLYITYAAYNVGWSNWYSYGCDLGKCYDGAVYRFEITTNGEVVEALDITPTNKDFRDSEAIDRRLDYGMGGIGIDKQREGTLICSTITSKPDTIYRSTDYGLTWKSIMSGLKVGKIDFKVSYQKAKYSGNDSCVHWMSDVKINPFDSDMAFFNTGIGIFMTKNLTHADQEGEINWVTASEGVEETVHLNIYSPPIGEAKLIDIVGDYGGFVFKDLDTCAENTIANSKGDRWITMMNADYPDSNPMVIVTTPRGNWTGHTKGGLIITSDQGENWEQLKDPIGISEEIDELILNIKKPNVTSGWVAISQEGETIIWAVGQNISATSLVYTTNHGDDWSKSMVYDLEGKLITDSDIPIKVMADREDPNIFYGFGKKLKGASFYVSSDKGISFNQLQPPKGFPELTLSGIDSNMPYEIRVEKGVIWIALVDEGLWRITFDKKDKLFFGHRVSLTGDIINRVGFGKKGIDYHTKMIYTSGTIQGKYGFYRSMDGGVNWKRINDDKHQYGDIRSITGDPRVFGRIYVATGTRGVLYGDTIWREEI
ncbi:MAG TPA: endoglucanase [Clostridiaceae bacterium]